MPRRRRWPSRSRCARRWRRQARPRRWSRPTARWPAACWRRWRAGTCGRRFRRRRARRHAGRACSRGWRPKPRSAGLPPVTLLALLKHPLCGSAPRGAHAARSPPGARGPARAAPRAGQPASRMRLQPSATELGKFRARKHRDLHPSDPRTALSDGELVAAAALVATAHGRARAAGELDRRAARLRRPCRAPSRRPRRLEHRRARSASGLRRP